MNTEIQNLEPKEVWSVFKQIVAIPRPSNHEDKIREWVYNYGKNLGLESVIDEVGNVIIKKPATEGMENCKPVIIQGHMDMVPQKNSDKQHDFEKDPIEAYIDDEWVTANGTTLGADNGIGVSSALAVLAADWIKHGPLEVLITTTEETGMDGAMGLKPDALEGEILLNTDTEEDGVFSIGCAGGVNVSAIIKNKLKKTDEKLVALKLDVTGLKGGHSGVDIHLGRGNSNKIFFRLLKTAQEKFGVKLASVDGGSLRNAIPRETFGVILVKESKVKKFKKFVADFTETINEELAHVENEIKIAVQKTKLPKYYMTGSVQTKLTNAVWAAPNDVIRMSDTMPGTVETSTNLAIVKSDKEKIEMRCLVRSFSETAKMALASRLESVFLLAGAKVEFAGGYPGWQPNVESEILKVAQDRYEEQFGKKPELLAMHAGLECGILGATYPNWDMISFGPTIKYPHSPDEKVNIETVQKYWNFLLNILAHIPEK